MKKAKFRSILPFCMVFVLFIALKEPFVLWNPCPKGDICKLAGKKVRVEGEVISLPNERLEKNIIEIKANHGEFAGNMQVILPHTQFSFEYSDKITLAGKIKIPKRSPEDNFSYPLYLAGNGIYSVMDSPVILRSQPGSPSLYKLILKLREKIRRIINRNLPEPDVAIMNSMIIGDQGSVPKDLRKKLSEVGIIHILSVSGTHVTLLIAIITFLIGRVTSSRNFILAVVLLGIILYLVIAGSPNCALRSGLMGILAFVALYQGRAQNLKIPLWFSGSILLLFSPGAIYSDIGFELSFLAIVGMAYIYPIFDKIFTWGRWGLFWNLLRVILLSIAISLTTTPLVYYYFGIISWISPLANLILIPLFSALLPLGLILILLFPIPWFSNLLSILIHFQFIVLRFLIELILKIPGAYTEGTVKPGWIILYYLGLIIIFVSLYFLVEKYIFPKRLDYFEKEDYLNKEIKSGSRILKKIKNKIPNKYILLLFSIPCCLIIISAYYLYASGQPARLLVLNVGQGDAILLDWPKYSLQILIDGGPGRNVLPELGETLPFYDRKIEMIILTHAHQDHIEGLINILDRYNVALVINNSIPSEKDGALAKIFWQKIADKKIPVAIAKKGLQFNFEDTNFRFITPLFDYSRYPIANLNNASVVLKMNRPRNVLFTGDAQAELEKVLLDKEKENLPSEILKIGHHGSRFSSANEFLDTVQARKALISVGKNNLYRHPAWSTLEKLEKRNIKIYRTDMDGRIELDLN